MINVTIEKLDNSWYEVTYIKDRTSVKFTSPTDECAIREVSNRLNIKINLIWR